MNWNDLKHFLAVARDGQMLSASRKLKVSQATLNRRIGRLEQDLGKLLFDRSTSGCLLTPAGQALLLHAERVENEMIRTTAELSEDAHALSGPVRIGAPDGFGVSFLAPRLHELCERHPGLQIQLVPVPRVFSLSRREADIAITIGRPVKGRLRVRKLTDYSLRLYASKGYLENHGEPRQLAELDGHRLVGYVEDLVFSSELEYNRQILDNWQSTIEISGVIGQLEAVRAGAGIGVLHDFLASADSSLVPILADESVLLRSYWMVWHESLKNSRQVQAVVEFLVRAVQDPAVRF